MADPGFHTIKKIGEQAVEYLERVKTEHAGTPWAQMAEMERVHS